MRKHLLISLLREYREQIGSGVVDYRIEYLENYLGTPEVQSLNQQDDVHLAGFVRFLTANNDISDTMMYDFFSEAFFESRNNALPLFKQIFEAEDELLRKRAEEELLRKRAEEELLQKRAEEELLRKRAEEELLRKRAEEELLRKESMLKELPLDIIKSELISRLGPTDTIRLSEVSLMFRDATGKQRVANHWRQKFIEIGIDTDLYDELTKFLQDQDYEKFYQAYCNVIKSRDNLISNRPKERWELLFLTGEPKAISDALRIVNEAKAKPQVDKYSKLQLDSKMLECVLLSGNVEAIEKLHQEYKIPLPPESLSIVALTGDIPSIEYVLKHLNLATADIRNKFSILSKALSSGSVAAFDYLFERLQVKSENAKKNTETLFEGAGESGSVAVLKHLLNFFKKNKVEIKDDCIRTGFRSSVKSGQTEAILFMINFAKEYGFDMEKLAPEARLANEVNILIQAAIWGRTGAFDLLLPLCPHLNLTDRYRNIVLSAAQSGSVQMIKRVLALCRDLKINPADYVDESDMNILHKVVSTGCLPAIKFLIEKCPDIPLDSVNSFDNTLFHYAAKAKNASAIIYLREVCAKRNLSITPATENLLHLDATKYADADDRIKDALTRPLSKPVLSAGPGR